MSSLTIRRADNNQNILTGTIRVIASFPKRDRDKDATYIKKVLFLKREYDKLRKNPLKILQAVASSLPAELQLLTITYNDRKASKPSLSVTGSGPIEFGQLVDTFKKDLGGIMENVGLKMDGVTVKKNPIGWSLNCLLIMKGGEEQKNQ